MLVNDANLRSFLGNDHEIELVDMGQIDDEDQKYLIVDKDTGNVYDIRKSEHVEHLTNKATIQTSSPDKVESTWSNWWKEKR